MVTLTLTMGEEPVAFLAERRRGRGSSVRALVNPDHESAINSGLLLLLPDAALYRDGLRVLHAGKVCK